MARVDDEAPPTPLSPAMAMSTRSSKSAASSFRSATSDDASTLDNVSNFEEIGLEDDDDTATPRRTANGISSSSAAASRRQPSPTPPSTASSGGGRMLVSSKRAPKPRSSFPNLRSAVPASSVRSTSLTVLTDTSRPALNRSSSSLSSSSRQRSPSPGGGLSPSMAHPPRRDLSLQPSRPRRGSWQSAHRKSFAELEHECDEDDGDDIPDGLILDNVPMSPRPQHERPPSRQPSPSSSDRQPHQPKERVRSVGNGTPPVAQAQGSLRSPTWKTDAAADRPHAAKSRAHSWNAALAHLSAEAKALTEKLEEHADEEESRALSRAAARPNTWNSASSSSSTYSAGKKERIRSTPELPPLQRGGAAMMIDPLPVSKEKEAVLSRTRPSWLPPKNPAEERRHVREYQKMMAASAKADERREAARRSRTEQRDNTLTGAVRAWDEDVIPRWNDAIREKKTRELWWRGVPPRCRGTVWLQAIGNDLGLSERSFDTALGRARELESRVDEDRGDADDIRRAQCFDQIRHDAANATYTDLHIFHEQGPLYRLLVDVLMAYAMYRSDIGYVSGCNTIAALLLLNLPSPATTFIALANVLNRPLPLSFYTGDAGAQSSAYNLVLQMLSQKSATLHTHLTRGIPGLEPAWYLADMYTSLFTGHLAVDEAARLWDVYVFEGDAVLVRAAVAILLSNEMALLGSTTEAGVKSVLLSRPKTTTDTAGSDAKAIAEDKFIATVREAGKR
ncbi:TBC protein [Geosmithia morbida]|uniref:TBC protein n=1 Tax=Geosmithia morbida TaxID=1094350 RepID=A0A9P4Z2J4_9HYPO|nr:TBC protein [Geosmithia morbida]KAF4127002.1 TBC protein [Geosmithia morbida]